MAVHAGAEIGADLLRQRTRGHGDDRHAARRVASARICRVGRNSVEHRHLDVHQDNVEFLRLHRRDSLLAVLGKLDAMARGLKDGARHLAIDVVVLDDEDEARLWRRIGRQN